MADANEFTVSTKQTDAGWNREDAKQIVRYVPSSNTKQRLRWRAIWMQVEFVIGYEVSAHPRVNLVQYTNDPSGRKRAHEWWLD